MRAARNSEFASVGLARIDLPTTNVIRARGFNEQAMDGEPHFTQLANILRRRSKLILTVMAVGGMLAGAGGLLIPPRYTATAQLIVEPQQAEFLDGLAATTRATDASTIDTQITMLSSRNHLQRVLDSLSREQDFRALPQAEAEPDAFDGKPPDSTRPISVGVEGFAALSASPDDKLSVGELGRRLKVWFEALFITGNAAARDLR